MAGTGGLWLSVYHVALQSGGGEECWSVAFAFFLGENTPTIADFKRFEVVPHCIVFPPYRQKPSQEYK